MKRIIILLLALMPVIIQAQELSKEEKKAMKAEIKAERKRAKAEKDSIYKAQEEAREARLNEEWRKSKSTSLLIITPFESQKDIFDALVHRMMQDGTIPAYLDKEYYIIRTARKQISVGTYDITYSVFKKDGKVCVRASGMGYGSFSVSSGMFRSDNDMIVPLEYGSAKGSTAKTAWDEIERYLLDIEHIEAIYESPE